MVRRNLNFQKFQGFFYHIYVVLSCYTWFLQEFYIPADCRIQAADSRFWPKILSRICGLSEPQISAQNLQPAEKKKNLRYFVADPSADFCTPKRFLIWEIEILGNNTRSVAHIFHRRKSFYIMVRLLFSGRSINPTKGLPGCPATVFFFFFFVGGGKMPIPGWVDPGQRPQNFF